ncbi:SDR family oxidoreductase [Flavobacterium sp. LB2P84]|jgi:NAD(P)-dependent dehydrogenase (short-subunit alcohol dehydrogenase family)|uniref:SDR family oxidoreductase n=1 Tax=Flavobacterium yafengii TaxID=3041253 RepID=A0AAW6TQI8_9FLAO|nr:SDR family oxidoreductase [Flavobacterium yafengii]MDI5949943.1 SDR family oxidoreductase [Flavobacterium yafengii]MDI6033916.1 SDR family oxidoreductase [Flavobacterium yafengii]
MDNLFNLKGKVALVTGGSGVLGGQMGEVLAKAGATAVIMGSTLAKADIVVNKIKANGGEAFAVAANVLDKPSLEKVKDLILEKYGRLDILINAAGGNVPGATIAPDNTIFNMPTVDLEKVLDLNIIGTILPTQVFSEIFANQKQGVIINISSATAQRPLTRVVGYSASKAAIDNFTKWMAVEMATKFGEGIRVNAIAPGFFIGEQNRALLLEPDGGLTARGKKIIEQTPMRRFGNPEDLGGTLIWLCSDASKFITGIIVNVDGGFGVSSI